MHAIEKLFAIEANLLKGAEFACVLGSSDDTSDWQFPLQLHRQLLPQPP